MTATIVTTNEELQQIVELSGKYMRANFSEADQHTHGFLTWNYSFELLQQMNTQQPHVIVKDGERVIAYALVALKEARQFHPDLNAMIEQLETVEYNNEKLSDYKYYVMGQVCVDAAYRGNNVFKMLYLHHKKLFAEDFDFVATEISTTNKRSIRAHEKVGFKTIYTYSDALDEWNVVVWEWE